MLRQTVQPLPNLCPTAVQARGLDRALSNPICPTPSVQPSVQPNLSNPPHVRCSPTARVRCSPDKLLTAHSNSPGKNLTGMRAGGARGRSARAEHAGGARGRSMRPARTAAGKRTSRCSPIGASKMCWTCWLPAALPRALWPECHLVSRLKRATRATQGSPSRSPTAGTPPGPWSETIPVRHVRVVSKTARMHIPVLTRPR